MGEDFIVLFAWERGSSERKEVEDDANAEEIADGAVLGFKVLEVDNLGSDVSWCTAADKHVVLVGELSESEVGDDAVEVSVLPEEDVFRLEVSVHDVLRVHHFESFQNALHHHLDLLGREFMLGLDFVVELSAFQQLHRNVDGVLRLVDFI